MNAPRRPPFYQDLHVLGALSSLSALLLVWTFPYWGGSLHVPCVFRELTGIPCPTCYGTRAMLALVAGNWEAAVRFNPLVAAGGMALFAYIPWALATAYWGRGRPAMVSSSMGWAWSGVLLVLVNWAYLIVAHP